MIAILDYGSGNLRSAQRAFATTGEEVVVTSDSQICRAAAGLVVPGVGAFQACMRGLLAVGGDQIIRERVKSGGRTLGICVGMQILFSQGTEPSRDGIEQKGVGIWEGSIDKLNAPILPHMGWNTVSAPIDSQLFKGIAGEPFYFVHSYAAKRAAVDLVTWAEYGEPFVAALEDGAVSATQFHPEKSGRAGLALIQNWVATL